MAHHGGTATHLVPSAAAHHTHAVMHHPHTSGTAHHALHALHVSDHAIPHLGVELGLMTQSRIFNLGCIGPHLRHVRAHFADMVLHVLHVLLVHVGCRRNRGLHLGILHRSLNSLGSLSCH